MKFESNIEMQPAKPSKCRRSDIWAVVSRLSRRNVPRSAHDIAKICTPDAAEGDAVLSSFSCVGITAHQLDPSTAITASLRQSDLLSSKQLSLLWNEWTGKALQQKDDIW